MGIGNKECAVYVKNCPDYDRGRIREIVKEGMRELGFSPQGKIFVKPNMVVAHDPKVWGRHAYTNVAVLGAAVQALAEAPDTGRIDVGEKSAVGFPTRMCYQFGGYYDEIARVNQDSPKPAGIFCIDEEKRDPVHVGGQVHEIIRVSRKMNRADQKVFLPKLKCHCVSNVTGAVKLNVGSLSEDERSIRHDFLLDDKIVDILAVGYPDFTIMDAITIGVGNEGFPITRELGLIIMSRNPVAADMIGSRLLGFKVAQVPYLQKAVERGYKPDRIEDIPVRGDLKSLDDVDEAAKRVQPYDDEFYRWQDVNKELERLKAPMHFYWGPYREGGDRRCQTGCVMGLKMFLACFELYAGTEAFPKAHPSIFIIGRIDEEIDAKGANAYIFGSCGQARIINARKVTRIDKCFTTVSDMMMVMGAKLGMKSPIRDMNYLMPIVKGVLSAAAHKTVNGRYTQDIGYFLSKRLIKRI